MSKSSIFFFGHAGLLLVAVIVALVFSGGEANQLAGQRIGAQVEADVPPLSNEMLRAGDWVSRRYKVSTAAIEPALRAAENSGRSFGVDPLLLVAIMAIESSFNPFAESAAGAQGLMQVIPRFHMDKIGKNADKDALFDPELNVRVGAQVLREGLRRYGNLETALQYYGGALNDTNAAYANRVLTMKQRLSGAAGRRDAQTAKNRTV